MKLNDRVWYLFNKKPQNKLMSYLQIVLIWCTIGFVMVLASLSVKVGEITYGVVCIGYILWLIWYSYRWDEKNGYIDAIHKHYLEKRTERLKRLNISGN